MFIICSQQKFNIFCNQKSLHLRLLNYMGKVKTEKSYSTVIILASCFPLSNLSTAPGLSYLCRNASWSFQLISLTCLNSSFMEWLCLVACSVSTELLRKVLLKTNSLALIRWTLLYLIFEIGTHPCICSALLSFHVNNTNSLFSLLGSILLALHLLNLSSFITSEVGSQSIRAFNLYE